MKKKISILLAVTMLLSGCNTAEKTEQTTAESTVATIAEAAETMASTTTGLTTVSNPVEKNKN